MDVSFWNERRQIFEVKKLIDFNVL
jgi:hypothetical protein